MSLNSISITVLLQTIYRESHSLTRLILKLINFHFIFINCFKHFRRLCCSIHIFLSSLFDWISTQPSSVPEHTHSSVIFSCFCISPRSSTHPICVCLLIHRHCHSPLIEFNQIDMTLSNSCTSLTSRMKRKKKIRWK